MGTAAGLYVAHDPHATPAVEGEVIVDPGLAVDPLGRLVEVTSRSCIRVKRWYEGYAPNTLLIRPKADLHVGLPTASLPDYAVVADLFLRFRTYERGWTPALASGLYDATDAVSPARLRDGYELRLVPRVESLPPDVPKAPWPPTLNGKPWPDPSVDEATRRTKLKEAIFAAWHPGRPALLDALRASEFLPAELRFDTEQPDGKELDPSWVFLARVVIAVSQTELEMAADGTKRPKRTGTVLVDNEMRPFAVTVAALARWLGI